MNRKILNILSISINTSTSRVIGGEREHMEFVKNVKLESGMPVLVIKTADGKQYGLIPYRKYDFSIVSYNEDKNRCGDCCIADGLHSVLFTEICEGMKPIGKYNYITGQAAACLCNFSYIVNECIPARVSQGWNPNTFNIFMKECFEYIFGDEEFPYNI